MNLKTEIIIWDKTFENEISEAYRLFKDQENKIFDLAWYEENPGYTVMDMIENSIKGDGVFVVKDGDTVAGVFILESPRLYKNFIISANVHCAVSKKYWGKSSREVCNCFKKYLQDNYTISRLLAYVPQCGYGLIKLLKDIGFHHEGTIKKVLVYKDKNGNDKLYDRLIYGLDLEVSNG